MHFPCCFGFACILYLVSQLQFPTVCAAESNDTTKKYAPLEGRTAIGFHEVTLGDASPLYLAQQSYGQEVAIEPPPPQAAAVPRSSLYGAVKLGDACTSNYECSHIATGARCFGEVCACGFDAVTFADALCLNRAKHFGDQCVISAQCKNLDLLATCYVSKKMTSIFPANTQQMNLDSRTRAIECTRKNVASIPICGNVCGYGGSLAYVHVMYMKRHVVFNPNNYTARSVHV